MSDVKMYSEAEVGAWLRQEARLMVTPHVRRVLLHLAKYVEAGGVIPLADHPEAQGPLSERREDEP